MCNVKFSCIEHGLLFIYTNRAVESFMCALNILYLELKKSSLPCYIMCAMLSYYLETWRFYY